MLDEMTSGQNAFYLPYFWKFKNLEQYYSKHSTAMKYSLN